MSEPTQSPFPGAPDAFEAMAALHRTHRGLPEAYTVIESPSQVQIQVPSFSALETWREALGVDTGKVRLAVHGNGRDASVAFPTAVGPVRVRVYTVAHNLLPGPDADREAGLLAEQRHQYRDLDADSACCLPGLSCPACPPRTAVAA